MKPFYLYFFLMSIKNDDDFKKISELLKRFSSYCDVKYWPLEGYFPPAF